MKHRTAPMKTPRKHVAEADTAAIRLQPPILVEMSTDQQQQALAALAELLLPLFVVLGAKPAA